MHAHDPKAHQEYCEHDSHDLELSLKIPAHRILQVVCHHGHPLHDRLRKNLLGPQDDIFSVSNEEIGGDDGDDKGDQDRGDALGKIPRRRHRWLTDAADNAAHGLIQIGGKGIQSLLHISRKKRKNLGGPLPNLTKALLQVPVHGREILYQRADLSPYPADCQVDQPDTGCQHGYDDDGGPQLFDDLQPLFKKNHKRAGNKRQEPAYHKGHEIEQRLHAHIDK